MKTTKTSTTTRNIRIIRSASGPVGRVDHNTCRISEGQTGLKTITVRKGILADLGYEYGKTTIVFAEEGRDTLFIRVSTNGLGRSLAIRTDGSVSTTIADSHLHIGDYRLTGNDFTTDNGDRYIEFERVTEGVTVKEV